MRQPTAKGHRWFDLQTTRGWVEVIGTFVTVVGSAVGIYFQILAKNGSGKKDGVPEVKVEGTISPQSNSPVVVGSPQTTIQITTGYTVEQHEQRLKAREQELRKEFETARAQSEEKRKIERDLQDVQGQIRNIQKSYIDRAAEIQHNTLSIVQKIRCEAREALDEITAEYLMKYGANEFTHEVANRLKLHTLSGYELWQGPYFERMGVVTEPGTTLLRMLTVSAVTFDFRFNTGTSASYKSGGERNFLVTDSFFELHTILPETCIRLAAEADKNVYPIAGEIGIQEVFRTFMEIASLHPADLINQSRPKAKKADEESSEFTERLTFTINLSEHSGSRDTTNPSDDRKLRLARVSTKPDLQGINTHEVRIAIARGSLTKVLTSTNLADARAEAKRRSYELAKAARAKETHSTP